MRATEAADGLYKEGDGGCYFKNELDETICSTDNRFGIDVAIMEGKV